jgi:maltose alpha-D-glucosyltransferase/alpha-amylase
MVRSFSYAAYAALLAFTVHAPDDYAMLEPWAETWQRWIAAAFLSAYRTSMTMATDGAASHSDTFTLVPQGDEAFDATLRAFMLEKACYEMEYELNNRPDWVRIPLAGVLKLADHLQS